MLSKADWRTKELVKPTSGTELVLAECSQRYMGRKRGKSFMGTKRRALGRRKKRKVKMKCV